LQGFAYERTQKPNEAWEISTPHPRPGRKNWDLQEESERGCHELIFNVRQSHCRKAWGKKKKEKHYPKKDNF